jgi:hypothetical protein
MQRFDHTRLYALVATLRRHAHTRSMTSCTGTRLGDSHYRQIALYTLDYAVMSDSFFQNGAKIQKKNENSKSLLKIICI